MPDRRQRACRLGGLGRVCRPGGLGRACRPGGLGRVCWPGGLGVGRACRPGGLGLGAAGRPEGLGRACRPDGRGRGLRAGSRRRGRCLLRLGRGVSAYRRILVLPEIGSRPDDRRMPPTQRGRPQLRDAGEGLPRLVLVPQLLGHRSDVVRDLQHQRIGVTKPPQPSRVRILEHPPSRNRIVILKQ